MEPWLAPIIAGVAIIFLGIAVAAWAGWQLGTTAIASTAFVSGTGAIITGTVLWAVGDDWSEIRCGPVKVVRRTPPPESTPYEPRRDAA